MNKIEQKHSKWFKRIQKVHANILLGIEMQKREFESNIDKKKKHEEIEKYFRDKEKAFDLKKRNEFQHIGSFKEKVERSVNKLLLKRRKLLLRKLRSLWKNN
jgi:hypothetical protein